MDKSKEQILIDTIAADISTIGKKTGQYIYYRKQPYSEMYDLCFPPKETCVMESLYEMRVFLRGFLCCVFLMEEE